MEEENLDEFVEVVLFLILQGAYAEVTGYHFFAFGLWISRPLRQLWRRLLSLWGYDASLSVVGACVCIAVCDPASARSARWCAATSLWARIALGSPWFWCSCSLPCAFACGYVSVGKDCACLSVVLVLGSLPCALVCVRIRPYGQGLRLSLRVSGARVHCRM